MASLTLRTVKGTPLTNAELDANFTALNTDVTSRLLASSNLSDLSNAATARTNLGLGNVENKSSATIRGELTSLNVTTALGFTPYNASNPNSYVDAPGARNAISVSGSLAYNATTGVISFTDAVTSVFGRTGAVALTQSDVTAVLGAGSITNTMLANTAVATLSGTNTGDETAATIKTKLGITTLSGSNTGDQTITLTGDVTGSGTGSFAATLAASGVTAGTYTKVTVDAKGRVTVGASLASADLPTYTGSLTSSQVTTALGFTPLSNATSYLPLAGGTLTGNLAFNGTGLRITGDFSNSTLANRLAFQTSTTNGNTGVFLLPNGTSQISTLRTYNNSDPTNAAYAQLQVNASQVSLVSAASGTGTVLPLAVLVGSTEVARASTGYNLLVGTTTDDGVNKLQVNGSVSATQFNGSGAGLTGTAASLTAGAVSSISSAQVTTALGFTPYNSTNPNGYITGSGNAATATSSPLLSALGNYVWSASTLPTGYNQGVQASFVSSTQGFQSYGSVMTVNTYSGGGGALQLYVPYSPTYGGTGLQVRFGNYDVSSGNSWTSWKTLLASDNYSSYALPLSGGTMSGTIGSSRNDLQRLFESYNTSAGGPVQFFIDHSYGDVNIGNARGALKIQGSVALHAGNYTSYTNPTSSNDVYPGTAYAYTHGYIGGDSTQDFNATVLQGQSSAASINATSNTPFGSAWYNMLNVRHRGGSGDGYAWGGQLVWGMTSYQNRLAFRVNNGGATSWSSWTEALTSANYSSYALPLSGGTLTGNLKITPVSENWSEGIAFLMPTTGTWGGLRWQRQRGNYDGNWYVGFTALDSSDDLVFGANNGGTQVNNILRLSKAGVMTNNGNQVLHAGNYTSYTNSSYLPWQTANTSFYVGGSSSTFYPVLLTTSSSYTDGWNAGADFEIFRDDVHENFSGAGSFRLRVYGQYSSWGHRPGQIMRVEYTPGYGTYSDPVGDVTAGDSRESYVVVWLRGGMTYHLKSLGWNYVYVAGGNPSGTSVSGSYATYSPISSQSTAIANAKNGVALFGNAVLTSANCGSYALPLSGGTLTGNLTLNGGDLYSYRSGGTTGVVYLNSAGTAYLYWNGSTYYLGSGQVALHSGNYSSYALNLGGGTMTGAVSFSQGGATRHIGMWGTYDPTRPAQIWAMSSAYTLNSDGGAGNCYGLTYSYEPNYGGTGNNPGAVSGLSHQIQWREAGAVRTAFGYGVWTAGNITAYSDERLKTNWRELPTDFVEQLAGVKAGTYDRTDSNLTQVGVSAQSLRPVLNFAVTQNADGMLSVAYGNAAMVSAVELAKRVVDQEKRIAKLETLINQLIGD